MAATQRTIDYNALLTMTADAYYKSGVIHDGVFKSNPTFAELNKKGLKMIQSGGSKIQVNLMYGKNSTVDSYSRYGLLDTAPQDGFTPAFYDWAQYAGTVSIDGLSEAQNSGTPEIQKLLREKVKQSLMLRPLPLLPATAERTSSLSPTSHRLILPAVSTPV